MRTNINFDFEQHVTKWRQTYAARSTHLLLLKTRLRILFWLYFRGVVASLPTKRLGVIV
jgi:hypothetical protein